MNYISIEQNQNEQIAQVIDFIKKALDAAHRTVEIGMKTTEIRKATKSDNYEVCFNIAQKGLKKYRGLINSISMLTNVRVFDITEEEARKKDIDYWKSVLNFVEMIIFVNSAGEIISKSRVEDKIKEIFKEKLPNKIDGGKANDR